MHPLRKAEIASKIFAQSTALKNAIDRIRDTPPDWYSTLLIDLASECQLNSLEMMTGINEDNPSRCAWATRNLLELSYFVRYVADSRENARRFHEDALCDLSDMLKKLEAIQQPGPLIDQGRAQLERYWKIMEQVSGEDSYLKVAKIADQLGEKLIYETTNKYLSKFVHPTSMSVQAKKLPQLKDSAIERTVQLALFVIDRAFPPLIKCLDAIERQRPDAS